jgi:hypothetical protein
VKGWSLDWDATWRKVERVMSYDGTMSRRIILGHKRAAYLRFLASTCFHLRFVYTFFYIHTCRSGIVVNEILAVIPCLM